ncbi:hypothetical protein RRG08_031116 [Elysia crispata]|uniref:Uncharacterized protein n=1 Tax=Elysia crispata TaxID=231223 RepID=A0AAE0ZF80_9GAST|nr:hypothetical protein RRG08_031116 [Elysia crispata]
MGRDGSGQETERNSIKLSLGLTDRSPHPPHMIGWTGGCHGSGLMLTVIACELHSRVSRLLPGVMEISARKDVTVIGLAGIGDRV